MAEVTVEYFRQAAARLLNVLEQVPPEERLDTAAIFLFNLDKGRFKDGLLTLADLAQNCC